MASNLDRREIVQDQSAAAASTIKAGSVPGSSVQFANTSSMSRVGSNNPLTGIVEAASALYSQYEKKKEEEWKVDGMMQYAQGATEIDIAKTGNKYTMAGFLTMKTKTASNDFRAEMLSAIDTQDHQLQPEEYRAKLSAHYKDLTDSMGQDPYVRRMLASQIEDIFPQLVAQQTAAHNKWREEQTFKETANMLTSELTRPDLTPEQRVEAFNELSDPKISGLNPDLHKKAVAAAVAQSLSQGSSAGFDALGAAELQKFSDIEAKANMPAGMLYAMRGAESNHRDFTEDGKPLEGPKVKGGTAKYAMQTMDATAADPGYGVTPAKDNSPAERNRVGIDYAVSLYKEFNGNVEHTLAAYNWGPTRVNKWIAAGADPAKLPMETTKYIKKIMADITARNVDKTNAVVQTMTEQGYAPEDIRSVLNANTEYVNKRTLEISARRTAFEEATPAAVLQSGNLDQALKDIQLYKEGENLSDEWAARQASIATNAYEQWRKEQEARATRMNAISTSTMYTLSSTDQQRAFDEIRAYASASGDQNTVDATVIQASVKNNLVDANLSQDIQSAFRMPISTDTTASNEGLSLAYSRAMAIEGSGNTELLGKYLGDTASTYYDIKQLVSNGVDPVDAYAAVQANKVNAQNKTTAAQVSSGVINDSVAKALDNKVPGFIDRIYNKHFAGYRTDGTHLPSDEDAAKILGRGLIQPRVQVLASALLAQSPYRDPKSVVDEAAAKVTSGMEIVLGIPVFGGSDKTIKEAMNVQGSNSSTIVNDSVVSFLRDHGEELLGDQYNKFEFTSPIRSILDKMSAIPSGTDIMYDADTETFRFRFPLNKDQTRYSPSIPVPAAVIGRNMEKYRR